MATSRYIQSSLSSKTQWSMEEQYQIWIPSNIYPELARSQKLSAMRFQFISQQVSQRQLSGRFVPTVAGLDMKCCLMDNIVFSSSYLFELISLINTVNYMNADCVNQKAEPYVATKYVRSSRLPQAVKQASSFPRGQILKKAVSPCIS